MEQCYHVVDDLESDFIRRIWWFDDSTKYRKIAPLVDPSALRSTLEADRPLFPSSCDSAELRPCWSLESRQQHPLRTRQHNNDYWVM